MDSLAVELAQKLRSAHCMLDFLCTQYCQRGGEREMVEALCQDIRNTYQSAFETLKGDACSSKIT